MAIRYLEPISQKPGCFLQSRLRYAK